MVYIVYIVYIVQSKQDRTFYTGITTKLKQRLKEHNSGLAKYSSSKLPLVLKWYCVFPNKKKAYDFEKYLKSHSGIAFRNKHLV